MKVLFSVLVLFLSLPIHAKNSDQTKWCYQAVCKTSDDACMSATDKKTVLNACGVGDPVCVVGVCAADADMCDSPYEMREVGKICTGVDGACVADLCAQKSGLCNTSFGLRSAVQACNTIQ